MLIVLQKNLKATSCPNTLRWFDLIQHVVVEANGLTTDFPLIEINLDDVPEPAAPVVAVSIYPKKKKKRAFIYIFFIEEG